MTKQEIGNLIRQERIAQNLNQTQLAEKAGLKYYQQIGLLEKGQGNYAIDLLIKVLNTLQSPLTLLPSRQSCSPTGMCIPILLDEVGQFDFSKVDAAEPENLEDQEIIVPLVTAKFKNPFSNQLKRQRL